MCRCQLYDGMWCKANTTVNRRITHYHSDDGNIEGKNAYTDH